MTETNNGGELYEQKFERVYAEVRRIDQLREADAGANRELANERTARLDQRMDAQDKAVTAALAAAEKAVNAALVASEKAVDKAEVAQKVVNEGQNEFRGTLKDQAATLMPRAESENLIRELRGLLAAQAQEIAGLRSRVDVGPPSLATLQTESDRSQGRQGQITDARALFFGAVAALAAIVAVVATIIAVVK